MFKGFNLSLGYKLALGFFSVALIAGGLHFLWNLPVSFNTERLKFTITRNRAFERQNELAQNANAGFDQSFDPFIEIVAPNGPEVWVRGGQYIITWNSNLDPSSSIYVVLVSSGGLAQQLFHPSVFPEGKNEGSYTFIVPENIEPGYYQILILGGLDCRIEKQEENCYLDVSDRPFIIK